MAVLLNDLFFPKTDPHTAALLSAFAFCSTYILRPFGALLFGYLGDHLGRKINVIISSFMMAFSCILMASLPTYDQIGITAAWGITFCRILQGLSSQGEIISVEVYLTEITKPPARYSLVSLTSFFASLGGMLALGLANLLNVLEINWRLAFWVGAAISSIGFAARTHLKETPVFLNTLIKKKNKETDEQTQQWNGELKFKTTLAYFLISCGYPACFFLAYIHCGNILKNTFNYNPVEIIHHNFMLSIIQCLSFFIYSYLSHSLNPLSILRFRLYIFVPFILLYPHIITVLHTPLDLFLCQSVIIGFGIMDVPAAGIFMAHFPVLKRITSTSFIYAFSRMAIYIITSFGMVYLTNIFNNWGVWVLMVFLCIGFGWGVRHFMLLEGATFFSLRNFLLNKIKQTKSINNQKKHYKSSN